ncbi:MAG: hypothetical protein ACPGSL_10525 [Vicingaceae bacterium]
MANIIENIKNYFKRKENNHNTSEAPEGVCKICWGHDEWDGKYYKIIKDKHLTPGDDIYESFISKIANKHVNTTHKHENKYICTTCNKDI